MVRPIRIGVLGGIGPEATLMYYSRLIYRLQRKGLIQCNQDYPQVIINSIPAPELTMENICQKDLEMYIRGIHELDQNNVDFIVMVCNTIHNYFDIMQYVAQAEIIDLRREVLLRLELLKSKALLLGTYSTINNDLFGTKNIVKPTGKEMEKISLAIHNYNRGHLKKVQRKIIKDICYKYYNEGVQNVLLGCTELAVMYIEGKFKCINTVDILVDATLTKISKLLNKTQIKGEVLCQK